MLKKLLIFVLVAAMLSLASCKVVEVIDHNTTPPEETTAPPKEYTPWGYWYSAQTSGAIELIEGSSVAKLYVLTAGYYEYDTVEEVSCTYDGNETFTLTREGTALTCVFDKYANTLTASDVVYVHQAKAPVKHPTFPYPDYPSIDMGTYITVGDIDFTSLTTPTLEGTRFEIAKAFYGSKNNIPAIDGIERAAQSGDYVNIDYCGKLNDVAFDNGTATNVRLFISDYQNGYIPGFTDGIIGHKVGETFDVNVTFPENYHATDLAGKAVVFTMTLNSIYNLTLTDEQVAGYKENDHQTYQAWVDEMQLSVAKSLFSNAILNAITNTETAVPSEIYLYYYQQTIDYLHALAYYNQISYDLLLMYYGINETSVLQQSISEATYNMALHVLAEKNALAWTQEDFENEYEKYVAEYLEDNKDATREDACKYADKYTAQIKDALTEKKVVDWALNFIFPAGE